MQPTTEEQQSAPRNGGAPPKYPHVKRMTDRHGRLRLYYRPSRRVVGVSLPVPEGSPDFVRAYALALAGIKDLPRELGADRRDAKTWDAALAGWQGTAEYQRNRASTKKSTHSAHIKFISKHFGSAPVAAMTADQLESLIDAKAAIHPSAARVLLSVFRGAVRFAIRKKWRADDPTAAIGKPKLTGSHVPWTDADIERYRRRHALGSTARLAIEVLLATGLRRSDAVLIGYAHVTDGKVVIEPFKTRDHKPKPLLARFPILPELADALAATPTGIKGKPWLARANGAAYDEDLFGRHFRQWCNEAGIDKSKSAHGVRKLCFERLALAGCSTHEILAWAGWSPKDLRMAALYTEGVDQQRLSDLAGAKMRGAA